MFRKQYHLRSPARTKRARQYGRDRADPSRRGSGGLSGSEPASAADRTPATAYPRPGALALALVPRRSLQGQPGRRPGCLRRTDSARSGVKSVSPAWLSDFSESRKTLARDSAGIVERGGSRFRLSGMASACERGVSGQNTPGDTSGACRVTAIKYPVVIN
jgi:hypothetical protein